MTITLTHAKTDNIADWTQAELDAQIALGNYPPGTVLADIVLPSDWNDAHTLADGTAGEIDITSSGSELIVNESAVNKVDRFLASCLSCGSIQYNIAAGNGVTVTSIGNVLSTTGTASTSNVATTSYYLMVNKVEYLITTPATNAVAGVRVTAAQFGINVAAASGGGGFFHAFLASPATGLSNASNRFFAGMTNSVAVLSDIDPSTQINCIGIGWDSADANLQLMHNDGSGTCTKIDLGASFVRPTADRTAVYVLRLFCAPSSSNIDYQVQEMSTGVTASGTVSSADIPSATTLLAHRAYTSSGGVSSVTGLAFMRLLTEKGT